MTMTALKRMKMRIQFLKMKKRNKLILQKKYYNRNKYYQYHIKQKYNLQHSRGGKTADKREEKRKEAPQIDIAKPSVD